MKKTLAFILALCLCLSMFGCGESSKPATQEASNKSENMTVKNREIPQEQAIIDYFTAKGMYSSEIEPEDGFSCKSTLFSYEFGQERIFLNVFPDESEAERYVDYINSYINSEDFTVISSVSEGNYVRLEISQNGSWYNILARIGNVELEAYCNYESRDMLIQMFDDLGF